MKSKFFCILSMFILLCNCLYLYGCKNNNEEVQVFSHLCNNSGECVLHENEIFDLSDYELSSIVTKTNKSQIKNCGRYKSKSGGEAIYKEIEFTDINLPIISINGDITNVTKTKTSNVQVDYISNNVTKKNMAGTIKVQGNTSAYYPKKNYTLKLESKENLVSAWGKQKKYCLKANWVDYSQARNVVTAKLYGEIAKSRNLEDEYQNLINGGAVDGFPVVVFANGNFHGLYTFNTPKDKWLFNMKNTDNKKQAILMANEVAPETLLTKKIPNNSWGNFETEFYENEESLTDSSSNWVKESFNNLIDFVSTAEGADFVENVRNYVNLERVIDSMILTFASTARDNLAKNILWVTYDGGQTWASVVYDLDGTWGMRWNGEIYTDYNIMNFSNLTNVNKLWVKIFNYMKEDVVTRYQQLRSTILTSANIENNFSTFLNQIPELVKNAEHTKWKDVPSSSKNNLTQIVTFANKHLESIDNVLLNNN